MSGDKLIKKKWRASKENRNFMGMKDFLFLKFKNGIITANTKIMDVLYKFISFADHPSAKYFHRKHQQTSFVSRRINKLINYTNLRNSQEIFFIIIFFILFIASMLNLFANK